MKKKKFEKIMIGLTWVGVISAIIGIILLLYKVIKGM
jgi:hypothetical protein